MRVIPAAATVCPWVELPVGAELRPHSECRPGSGARHGNPRIGHKSRKTFMITIMITGRARDRRGEG